MSDSVWPHRQQPTRLPRPWDSPGKNTGVGCHFLLPCMKVKSESEVAQSCPTQRRHGLQPTRLLCSWDFPGKSTGVGCHRLLWSWPLVSFKILALPRQGEGDACSWKECCSCNEYACSGLFISLALALKAKLNSHSISSWYTSIYHYVWKSLSCTTANNSVLFGANQRMGVRAGRRMLTFQKRGFSMELLAL